MLADRKRSNEYFQFNPMHPTFALVSTLTLLGLLAWSIAWTVE